MMKVYVVTHKDYWMPEESIYQPIQVGFGNDLGFLRDNTEENIASKNKNYCELTALYWIWKNTKSDVAGLVHYRRHFTMNHNKDKKTRLVSEEYLRDLLQNADIILPKPRNYFIETNQSQYEHAHHKEDLEVTKAVLLEKYPDMITAYEGVMKSTKGHRFNMMIMKWEYFDKYCQWLFDILFEVEKRLDISNYSDYDARVFGFLSERLLDVWVNYHHYSYKEVPVTFMENENWLVKGSNFLKRKFIGK